MTEEIFPRLLSCGTETVDSASYRFENFRRGERHNVVVQCTHAGRTWFQEKSRRTDVPAGWGMLFTYNEPTSYGFAENDTEPCTLSYLNIAIGQLAPFFDQIRRDFGSVVQIPPQSEAFSHFEEIMERFERRSFLDRLHESELIYRLLMAVYREQVQGTRATDPIEFGLHYLRNNFRSPINLKTVADKCGISREHFIREFTRRYGEPPGSLLRRLRLEHARAMLALSGPNLETIALASGYSSANTFCRAYRAYYHKSPSSDRPSGKNPLAPRT